MPPTTVTSPPPRWPLTKALETLLTEATGWPVGVLVTPRAKDGDSTTIVEPPYVVLYPLWPRFGAPAFADPHADVTWTYQARVVAKRADQLEWGLDRVRGAVIGRGPDGGWAYPLDLAAPLYIYDRDISDESGGDSSGDSTVSGMLSGDVRFTVTVGTAKG